MSVHVKRRIGSALVTLLALIAFLLFSQNSYEPKPVVAEVSPASSPNQTQALAKNVLEKLVVKGKSPLTGYSREEFYTNWPDINGCDARNVILKRDLSDTKMDECLVLSGTLLDPYTGKTINFERGKNSSAVQIDHVVALADAWKKGASQMDKTQRKSLASDPLNLLAVDGPANMQKSDSDAASWLPSNKAFRCQYVARQISVKYKYALWITDSEKNTMSQVLEKCPNEPALGVNLD